MTEDNMATRNTLMFSRGGFQGARGARQGAEFFVENVMEELDYPTEQVEFCIIIIMQQLM